MLLKRLVRRVGDEQIDGTRVQAIEPSDRVALRYTEARLLNRLAVGKDFRFAV